MELATTTVGAVSIQQQFVDAWISDSQHIYDPDDNSKHHNADFVKYAALSATDSTHFVTGTGANILSKIFSHIVDEVDHELIFVTCFWAQSESREQFCELLRDLSEKALLSPSQKKIRIRLCFSSLSLFQKLLDLRSEAGRLYSPYTWPTELGLPPSSELKGLDLQVLGVFQRPFCVMHPKFIIVDRKTCFLPSCNVSWEDWFEGCIELRGTVVHNFVQFWQCFWMRNEAFSIPSKPDWETTHHCTPDPHRQATKPRQAAQLTPIQQFISYKPVNKADTMAEQSTIPTLFLPSRHFRNPRFRPFPCQTAPKPSHTPLNCFTLRMFSNARRFIYLQTPNLTSPPVVAAILSAVARNVDVHIVTNSDLMTNEQLVTAGNTTPRCLHKLVKVYHSKKRMSRDVDLESSASRPMGKLLIEYFAPKPPQLDLRVGHNHREDGYPTHTHLKLTIIDAEVVILGSGNMDRASWYTSQELGVALMSTNLARRIAAQVALALEGRLQTMYSSTEDTRSQ